MSLAVIDASVMTAFYVLDADDPRRPLIESRLVVGDSLFAPAHLDADVVSALRGLSRRSTLARLDVPAALRHLAGFPIRRVPLAPLLQRIWQLRANVTADDAAYVALAERLEGPLVTSDLRLAAASGPACAFEVLG